MWPLVAGFFCLAYKVHPCCNVYPHFIPFYGKVIFHSMNISHLFICSSVDGHELFSLLAIVNNAFISTDVQISKSLLLLLLGIYSKVKVLGCRAPHFFILTFSFGFPCQFVFLCLRDL